MRRFRLSTLMMMIVIAALCIALVVQQDRAARREVELQLEFAKKPYGVQKVSKGREVAREEAARLRSVVEATEAKEGDEK
jgi:hypothetical protein